MVGFDGLNGWTSQATGEQLDDSRGLTNQKWEEETNKKQGYQDTYWIDLFKKILPKPRRITTKHHQNLCVFWVSFMEPKISNCIDLAKQLDFPSAEM